MFTLADTLLSSSFCVANVVGSTSASTSLYFLYILVVGVPLPTSDTPVLFAYVPSVTLSTIYI